MTFGYGPLRADRRDIRLLNLEPSPDQNAPLKLRIHSTSLDTAGDYTCLSYVWGEPEPTRPIQLNDQQFEVRENLFAALLHMRLLDKPRRLWVDAICINQDDTQERENQVAVMRHIYHAATDVIAWIGEETGPQDERGVAFLGQIKIQAGYTQSPETMVKAKANLKPETMQWMHSVSPFGFVNSPWLDLLAILERPWFSRIWIVQEVVMGRSVIVWCGHHRIEWIDFFYCALFVLQHADTLGNIAAPDCLRYHDVQAHRFFHSNLPLYRLNEAAKKIHCVGQLTSRRSIDRHVESFIGSGLKLLEETAKKNSIGQEVEIWGEISPDRWHIQLYYGKVLHRVSESTVDGCSGLEIRRLDNKDIAADPTHIEIITTDLKNSDGLRAQRQLFAVVGNRVPIYTTQEEPCSPSDGQRKQQFFGDRSTMYALFRRFRAFGASDPRDKVYALLGLAENVEYTPDPLPVIAYDPGVTIFDAVWSILDIEVRYNRSLGFLGDACGIERPEGFPSWMPLWDDRVPPPLTIDGKPCNLLDLEMEPLVIFKASGDTRPAANMVKDDKWLIIAGVACAIITSIGDVFDRDKSAINRLTTRKKWASMIGVEVLEQLTQILTNLQIVGYLSEEEARTRLRRFVEEHTQCKEAVYERFFGTMMGSVSSEGTASLIHRPLKGYGGASGNSRLKHFTHQLQSNVDGRIADVCHGRRFFTCSPRWSEDGGGDHINFGMCPSNAEPGDMVAMFLGSGVLHVIRLVGADGDGKPIWGLVGEAYVHSWMNGQLLERMRNPEKPEQLRATEIRLQ